MVVHTAAAPPPPRRRLAQSVCVPVTPTHAPRAGGRCQLRRPSVDRVPPSAADQALDIGVVVVVVMVVVVVVVGMELQMDARVEE